MIWPPLQPTKPPIPQMPLKDLNPGVLSSPKNNGKRSNGLLSTWIQLAEFYSPNLQTSKTWRAVECTGEKKQQVHWNCPSHEIKQKARPTWTVWRFLNWNMPAWGEEMAVPSARLVVVFGPSKGLVVRIQILTELEAESLQKISTTRSTTRSTTSHTCVDCRHSKC